MQRYRASLELLRPFLNMGNSRVTSQNIAIEEDLARVLALTGDYAAALDFANRAVAQAEKLITTSPSSERYTGAFARAYATLAAVQEKAGADRQARQSAEKALEIWKGVHDRGVISVHEGIMADTGKLLARLSPTAPDK
jgi:tetratricopeptide (TPR) repeat protein